VVNGLGCDTDTKFRRTWYTEKTYNDAKFGVLRYAYCLISYRTIKSDFPSKRHYFLLHSIRIPYPLPLLPGFLPFIPSTSQGFSTNTGQIHRYSSPLRHSHWSHPNLFFASIHTLFHHQSHPPKPYSHPNPPSSIPEPIYRQVYVL